MEILKIRIQTYVYVSSNYIIAQWKYVILHSCTVYRWVTIRDYQPQITFRDQLILKKMSGLPTYVTTVKTNRLIASV